MTASSTRIETICSKSIGVTCSSFSFGQKVDSCTYDHNRYAMYRYTGYVLSLDCQLWEQECVSARYGISRCCLFPPAANISTSLQRLEDYLCEEWDLKVQPETKYSIDGFICQFITILENLLINVVPSAGSLPRKGHISSLMFVKAPLYTSSDSLRCPVHRIQVL